MFDDCASMCSQVPLFYLNKNVDLGNPERTCTDSYLKSIPEKEQKRRAMGVQSAISALLLFFVLIAAFPNVVDI